MIYLGNDELLGVKLGNDDIQGIYVGEELIYPTTVTAWSITPSAITIGASGGTERIKIAALSSWTISSSESWVTFSQNSGNSGRTNLTATTAANTSTARTATITITDNDQYTETISVSQDGLAFEVTPSALTAGISAATLDLTIASPYAWTATSSESWATLSTGSGVNGITTITVSVPQNDTQSARTATITVGNGTDTSAITLTQTVVPPEMWVDLTTIDNNTPIYNIAWLTDQGFSTINDTWFAEKSGLTTDSYVDQGSGWSNGKSEAMGWYTYHRMSNNYKKYSCTFLDQYHTGNGSTVEYGVAMTDAFINQLPTGTINGTTYYMLNIVDWQNWKPLYMPLSTSKIQSTYVAGKIMVDIAPK